MGIEPFLTASALDCVVAQRLARKLCTHCKRRVVLSQESLKAAGFDAALDVEAYEPEGCPRCNHSGYKGRIGLYEVMTLSEEIRSKAIERTSADVIREIALSQGMTPLRVDGLDKVKQGLTSIAEVTRVC
jgi:type IV pilus assembly protein PilB